MNSDMNSQTTIQPTSNINDNTNDNMNNQTTTQSTSTTDADTIIKLAELAEKTLPDTLRNLEDDIKKNITITEIKDKKYIEDFIDLKNTYENIDAAAEQYWKKLKDMWFLLYPLLKKGDSNALQMLNAYLPPLFQNNVEIEYTFGEINRQNLEPYKNHIELYISPKLRKSNIPLIERLYNKRVALENTLVCKYRAYHPRDELLADIEYVETVEEQPKDLQLKNAYTDIIHKTFKACYDDFGYQGHYGYDENNKPIINLIILVKQPLANKILKKQKVNFRTEDGKTSSRDVWLPNKYNPIDLFLLNILGEYNLLKHTGYIEILPEDDPMNTKGSVFTELLDIKKSVDIVLKHYNYKLCGYCEHTELQTDLYACGKCKNINYCSKKCQQLHWRNHKLVCNISM